MSYVTWSFFCLAVNAFAEPIIRNWDILENALEFESNTFVNQFLELAHKYSKFQLVSGFFPSKKATLGAVFCVRRGHFSF